MAVYNIAVRISKQVDGLYRAECPHLQGCFVDGPTMASVLADIQDAIHLWLESQKAMGWDLPAGITPCDELPINTCIPVAVS